MEQADREEESSTAATTQRFVLTEEEALNLLSFLVTAAQVGLDEPPDSSPLRLLLAAQYLCADAAPRCSEKVVSFMRALEAEIPIKSAQRMKDPAAFATFLEDACRKLAQTLITYYSPQGKLPRP